MGWRDVVGGVQNEGETGSIALLLPSGKIVAIVQRLTAEAENNCGIRMKSMEAGPPVMRESAGTVCSRSFSEETQQTCQSQKSLPWWRLPVKHFQRWGRRWPTSC